MVWQFPIDSSPDNRVEIGLDFEQHPDRDVEFALGCQHPQQVPVALSLSDIDRPLAASILERPPRRNPYQTLGNLDRRSAMCGLVKRSIERRPAGSGRVDEFLV